jgi:Bin/amphiphysin/Rvs domain for vesicular trafficking
LASALEKYALAEEKVGEARLAQDAQIQSRFLAGWSTTLNTNLQFAQKARKSVENSRLMLDSTKAAKKSAIQGRGMNPDDEGHLSEEARAEIEAAEDEFVNQTEEAVGVMKNVRLAREFSTLMMANPQHRYSTRLNLYAIWQT